jgi:SUKH-4 immunity protein
MTVFVPKNAQDFATFWHQSSVVCWEGRALEKISISAESKRFLKEVGLPQLSDWNLRFDTSVSWATPHLLSIGFDDPNPICLESGGTPEAVVVREEPHGRIRFINTSVARFGCFLVLYQQYRLQVRDLDETISQEFMRTNGLDHQKMTNKHRELFKELATSGRANTLSEHTRVAVEALKAGGMG